MFLHSITPLLYKSIAPCYQFTEYMQVCVYSGSNTPCSVIQWKRRQARQLLYLSSIVQEILKRKIVQILKVQKFTYCHAKSKRNSMEGAYSGIECPAIYQIIQSGLADSAHFW